MSCCTPSSDDDLWCAQNITQLVDHGSLDFGGGHSTDRACSGTFLYYRLADVIPVQPSPLRVCVGDMAQPVGYLTVRLPNGRFTYVP